MDSFRALQHAESWAWQLQGFLHEQQSGVALLEAGEWTLGHAVSTPKEMPPHLTTKGQGDKLATPVLQDEKPALFAPSPLPRSGPAPSGVYPVSVVL